MVALTFDARWVEKWGSYLTIPWNWIYIRYCTLIHEKLCAEAAAERAIQFKVNNLTICYASLLWREDGCKHHYILLVKTFPMIISWLEISEIKKWAKNKQCKAQASRRHRHLLYFISFRNQNQGEIYCFYIKFCTAAIKIKALIFACPCCPMLPTPLWTQQEPNRNASQFWKP